MSEYCGGGLLMNGLFIMAKLRYNADHYCFALNCKANNTNVFGSAAFFALLTRYTLCNLPSVTGSRFILIIVLPNPPRIINLIPGFTATSPIFFPSVAIQVELKSITVFWWLISCCYQIDRSNSRKVNII